MIISVLNDKWWVGKSLIVQNLAAYFSSIDKNVCIVDADINQSSLLRTTKRVGELPQIPIFVAHHSKLIKWLFPLLTNMYEYIVVDGSPSHPNLTTRIVELSDIILVPFSPSPTDWEITKQFIERHLCFTRSRTKSVLMWVILNQVDNSSWSKEYPIVIKNLDIQTKLLTLKRKSLYKKLQFYGKALIDETSKREGSDMKELCKGIDILVDRQRLLEKLIAF